MNGNPNRRKPQVEQRLDFENSREIERIRENELRARQRRARRIAENKRLEMRKRARIKQIKDAIGAWAILLGTIAVVIAVICMIVSSSNKTAPYDFYQYWRNVGDADVLKCIRMLTFLPVEEIDKMDAWEGAQLNTAKEILAYELTKLVHGEEEAEKAQSMARSLFVSGGAENAPEVEVDEASLVDGAIDLNSLLVLGKMVPSKSEGRRAIEQGGVSVDGEKVTDVRALITKEQLQAGVLVKRGKKSFNKFLLK